MQNNQLDKTDIEILKHLQKDAYISHKALAAKLHKSVTPIHIRIKRLEDEGYLKGYVALVDHTKIGRSLIAYTQVQLKVHSQDALKSFKDEVIELTEVMECYHMTGAFDFLLRIAIADMSEYNHLLMEKLSKLPDVGTMQSFFVMSEDKHETAYPHGSSIAALR